MTSKSVEKAVRIRRPTDLAARMRSWLWFAKLQSMYTQSEDWMDKKFLPKTDQRRRTFNQVKLKGSNPERRSEKLYRYSLVDKVDKHPKFRGSKIWFKSALHDLLIPPGLPAQDRARELTILSHRLGLFRPTSQQARVAEVLLPKNEAFKPLTLKDLKQLAVTLRKRSDIDGVTMLALLFCDAVASHNLESAIVLRSELLKAVDGMCVAVNLPSHQARLLKLLIARRLIQNDWSPIAVTPEFRQKHISVREEINRALGGSRTRRVDSNSIQDEVRLLIRQEEQAARDSSNWNWATRTPTIQFFLDNFDSFDAEVEHQRRLVMRTRFRKYQRTTAKPWRKTSLDYVPPRPKHIDQLLYKLRSQ